MIRQLCLVLVSYSRLMELLVASGICAWWGSWQCGVFRAHGLLLQKGQRLGTGTNNSAESHGVATAFKALTR